MMMSYITNVYYSYLKFSSVERLSTPEWNYSVLILLSCLFLFLLLCNLNFTWKG